MLSTHSFNALLKTLEEPPDHVKFLLATTDPQKLPVTVLSRCLQFNLKRLTPAVIQGQLERIVVAEGYEHDVPALTLLANAADGSMRDALSLLDQAIAHAGGALTRDAIADMLGTVERTHVVRLLQALGDRDGSAMMGVAAELAERGLGADSVLGELATACQQLALAQVVPEALSERVEDVEAVCALAARAPVDAVQLWYQIAVNGRRDLPLAPTPWVGLEMTLLRMLAFQLEEGDGPAEGGGAKPGGPVSGKAGRGGAAPAGTARAPAAAKAGAASAPPTSGLSEPAVPTPPAPAPVSQGSQGESPTSGRPTTSAGREGAAVASAEAPAGTSRSAPATLGTEPADATHRTKADGGAARASRGAQATSPVREDEASEAPRATQSLTASEASPQQVGDWDRFAESLGASGMQRQLADNCVVLGVDGKTLRLQLDEAREHLLTRQQCTAMERAWCEQHGDGWRLAFTVGAPQAQTAAQRAEQARRQQHQQALQSLREDPYVKALEQTFGARLLEDTVQARPAQVRKVTSSAVPTVTSSPAAPGAADAVREAGARR